MEFFNPSEQFSKLVDHDELDPSAAGALQAIFFEPANFAQFSELLNQGWTAQIEPLKVLANGKPHVWASVLFVGPEKESIMLTVRNTRFGSFMARVHSGEMFTRDYGFQATNLGIDLSKEIVKAVSKAVPLLKGVENPSYSYQFNNVKTTVVSITNEGFQAVADYDA